MNSLNNKLSVLIPDGDSVFALAVIRCLGLSQRINVDICSSDALSPSRFSRYVRSFFFQASEDDDEKRLESLRQIIKKAKPDVVLPVGESTIRFMSIYSGHLNDLTKVASQPATSVFDMANNKWRLAEFLKQRGLPSPNTFFYDVNCECDQILQDINYPVLAKPTMGGYGLGIEYIGNKLDMKSFMQRHLSSANFIIQSFIEGFDIDCSVLCKQGKILAYTIQKGFMPGYHQFASASGVDFVHNDDIYDVISRLIELLNWTGVAHIDLRYDMKERNFKIIEINPRYWGSLLGSLIAGVNFPYLACRSEMGIDFPVPEFKEVRFISGKAAFKSLLSFKYIGLGINNSTIQFIMQDPLPDITQSIVETCNRVKNIISF